MGPLTPPPTLFEDGRSQMEDGIVREREGERKPGAGGVGGGGSLRFWNSECGVRKPERGLSDLGASAVKPDWPPKTFPRPSDSVAPRWRRLPLTRGDWPRILAPFSLGLCEIPSGLVDLGADATAQSPMAHPHYASGLGNISADAGGLVPAHWPHFPWAFAKSPPATGAWVLTHPRNHPWPILTTPPAW